MKADQIAAEARREIVLTVSSIAAPEIDERVDAIIKSAIEKAFVQNVAAYMNGDSNEKVTEVLDNLLRENRALEKEISTYESESRAADTSVHHVACASSWGQPCDCGAAHASGASISMSGEPYWSERAARASENEGYALKRLSDALTGGNASTWDEIFHAAESSAAHASENTQWKWKVLEVLLHLMQSNHGFKPDSCDGCAEAELIMVEAHKIKTEDTPA